MHFEKNTVIPDTFEDEELLSLGKKKKKGKGKLYSAYIYRTLLEEASKDNPLKVKDICLRIIEKFKVYIDITTIQGHIKEIRKNNVMPDIKLYGKPHRGYYIKYKNGDAFLSKKELLDDIEINVLIQSIRRSRIASATAKKSIVEKLKNLLLGEETKSFLEKYGSVEKDREHNINLDLFAEDMVDVITNCRPIMLKFKNQEEYKEFYTYALIPCSDAYLLVGCYKGSEVAFVTTLSMITDYYAITDETFEKTPLRIKIGQMFDEQRINFLKSEYEKDFIFPSEKEVRACNEFIARIREAEKTNKNLTKEEKEELLKKYKKF